MTATCRHGYQAGDARIYEFVGRDVTAIEQHEQRCPGATFTAHPRAWWPGAAVCCLTCGSRVV